MNSVIWGEMEERISFLEVKEDPTYRQPYLLDILPHCPDSVKTLYYDPDKTKLYSWGYNRVHKKKSKKKNRNTYASVKYMPYNLGKGKTLPIFVFNPVFEKLDSEAQLLNVLIDHESFHVRDIVSGINMNNGIRIDYTNICELNPDSFKDLLEIRALDNQIKKLEDRGICDEWYREWLFSDRDHHKLRLTRRKPKSELEEKVLEEIK